MSLEYCAGLFDGEGCIFVMQAKQYNTLLLRVVMVEAGPLQMMAETVGGKVTKGKVTTEGRQSWDWSVSGSTALVVLRRLRPYLIGKAKEADVVLMWYPEPEWGHKPDMEARQYVRDELQYLRSIAGI